MSHAHAKNKATGLKLFNKNVHSGQGTSGIFLIFEESYFEFIRLRDIEEAKNNLLRFNKRIEAVKNGGSLFGMALRGDVSTEEPKMNINAGVQSKF